MKGIIYHGTQIQPFKNGKKTRWAVWAKGGFCLHFLRLSDAKAYIDEVGERENQE